ncbi:uncharacterized protein EAF02_006020 [Botrytis sinoallii]|uniref:uncharacterized protein n=1 Tax=Botrytis sinoallii TaxID=1463999 RepID=UPI0019011271|nr:uncharacterized protein EAF02_006020 [Botrytis sinoallii]KAF7882657.1 hypothetical protein EAF02_006020 [Botrytis sinoallii]
MADAKRNTPACSLAARPMPENSLCHLRYGLDIEGQYVFLMSKIENDHQLRERKKNRIIKGDFATSYEAWSFREDEIHAHDYDFETRGNLPFSFIADVTELRTCCMHTQRFSKHEIRTSAPPLRTHSGGLDNVADRLATSQCSLGKSETSHDTTTYDIANLRSFDQIRGEENHKEESNVRRRKIHVKEAISDLLPIEPLHGSTPRDADELQR